MVLWSEEIVTKQEDNVVLEGFKKARTGFIGALIQAVQRGQNISSVQYARIIDLVCEGEIEGLVDGLKSIRLNEIPLQNEDDTYNFLDAGGNPTVTVGYKYGTEDQTPIENFPSSESTINYNFKLRQGIPKDHAISDLTVGAVLLTVSTSSMISQFSDGDVSGSSVSFHFYLQNDGGPWQDFGESTILGYSRSTYQKTYRIELPSPGPWTVRVTRTTPDSNSISESNDLYLDCVTNVVLTKFNYPNSVLFGFRFDARTIGGLPSRAYHLKLKKVEIPSNYNPITRAYTGTWDGTFTIAWTDNPAWCWRDLIVNDRFGLAKYLKDRYPGGMPSLISKWDLYKIAQYCDEMVNDGKGGTEPRYTCNLFLQSAGEALKVVKDMASIFAAMTYWSTGGVAVVQDSPSIPIYTFTNSNVKDGHFDYSGSALGTRHTAALVSWNDPNDFSNAVVEYVEDNEGIQQYGYNPTEVLGLGCASQGQAHRLGLMILTTERILNETVSFKTSIEGHTVYPGAIINVGDTYKTGERWAGRVRVATRLTIGLDSPVTLEAGRTYKINCFIKPIGFTVVTTMPTSPGTPGDVIFNTDDGKYYKYVSDGWEIFNSIQEGTVQNGPGETSTIIVGGLDFTQAPDKETPWVLFSDSYELQQYRVVGWEEDNDGIYQTIVALIHNPDIYAAVESGAIIEPPVYPPSVSTEPINPCTELKIDPIIVRTANDLYYSLAFSWVAPTIILDSDPAKVREDDRVSYFQIRYKEGANGNYQYFISNTNTFTYPEAREGVHYLGVSAVSNTGLPDSPWVDIAYDLTSQVIMPNVTGLELFGQGNDIIASGKDFHFTWRATTYTLWAEIGDEPNGGDSGALDAYFKHYRVTIKDSNGNVIRTETVTTNEYVYTLAKNQSDAIEAGLTWPRRNITIEVILVGRQNQTSETPAKLTVTNPAPDMSTMIPDVTPAIWGLVIDWSKIIPSDPDVQKYEIYVDTSNPPTTLVYTASNVEDRLVYNNLSTEESYRVKILPYDFFGPGTGTIVPAAVSPLLISLVDIEGELSGTIKMSDSQSHTQAELAPLYNGDFSTTVYQYNDNDWVQYEFGIAEYIDRILFGVNGADVHWVYFSIDDGSGTWKWFSCAVGQHATDSENKLTEHASEALAEANYLISTKNPGINAVSLPNGIIGKRCRIHWAQASDRNIAEIQFIRAVIAEHGIFSTLDSLAASFGNIQAGIIEGPDYVTGDGGQWDLDNNTFTFKDGGVTVLSLSSSGADFTGTLSVTNPSEVRSDLNVEDGANVSGNLPPDDNLIAYWDLNEGEGLIAYDKSGNGNNGILTNSPTWITGISGKGLNFVDDNAQYVALDDDLLDISSPFSISLWVYTSLSDTGEHNRVFSMLESGGDTLCVAFLNEQYLWLQTAIGPTTKDRYTPTPITANAWHHAVVTSDGSQNYTAYINGNSVIFASSIPGAEPIVSGIGTHAGTSLVSWNGKIDEVRVYNKVLTAEEVRALYNNPSGNQSIIPWQSLVSSLPADTDLIAYWDFDEGSGTVASDKSGNGYDGTLTSASWVTGVSGKAFDTAVGTKRVTVSDNGLDKIGDTDVGDYPNVTFSFWIKGPNPPSSYGLLYDKYQDGSNHFYACSNHVANELRIGINKTGLVSPLIKNFTDINPFDGALHHIAVLVDYTNNACTVYMDAVQTALAPLDLTDLKSLPDPGWDNTGDFSMGARNNGTYPYNGLIDEFRIYNRILTPLEIRTLYTYPSGNQSPPSYSAIAGTKPPSNADNTVTAIESTTTITGGGIVLSGGGAIKTIGKDTYDDATPGIYLGWDSGLSKYTLGIGTDTEHIEWDGTALNVAGDIINRGNIIANAVTDFVGSWTVGSFSLSASYQEVQSLTFDHEEGVDDDIDLWTYFGGIVGGTASASSTLDFQFGYWTGTACATTFNPLFTVNVGGAHICSPYGFVKPFFTSTPNRHCGASDEYIVQALNVRCTNITSPVIGGRYIFALGSYR